MPRKSLLETNPRVGSRIIHHLRNGVSLARACAVVGVPVDTVDGWLELGRNGNCKDIFVRFAEQADQAREAGIAARIDLISAHAVLDWKAAAWLLAHDDPATYGKTETVRVGGTKDGIPVRTQAQAAPSIDFTGWPAEDIEIFIAVQERNGVTVPDA